MATQNNDNVNILGGNLAGSGPNLYSLNADNLAYGTVPGARFPATLPAVNGSQLTNLNGYAIASGIIHPDRLANGGRSGTSFLRSDGWWAEIPQGAVKYIGFIKTGRFTIAVNSYVDLGMGFSLTYWPWAVFYPTHLTGGPNTQASAQIVGPSTIRAWNSETQAGYTCTTALVGYVVEYKNVG
jgi:hypothetical protein